MRTAKDILNLVETLAPSNYMMDWDNCGLLVGDPEQPVEKVLVALDPFENVCREAVEGGYQLILTHHPLLFSPARTVTTETSVGRCLRLLAKNDIAAINAHTNLDCADGGVNDTLAEVLGLQNVEVADSEVPHLLRCGTVEETELADFLKLVKEKLGCPGLRYAGNRKVHKVCVGGGACGDMFRDAFAAGCDTFVTSDVKYNQFWDARDLGMNIIDAGHFYTENPVCDALAHKVREAFPELLVEVSKIHRDCTNFF